MPHTDSETASVAQGSFIASKAIQLGLGCSEQPKPSECIRAAQEAWRRLLSSPDPTRQDWLLVGKACQLLRAEAMHTAHVNKPEGRRYNQEISYLLKANGLDDIGKADRSKLLFILDNIVEVERWLATVPANKQLKLNHPHTIWRAYKASVKKPDSTTPKRLSPTEKLKQEIVSLKDTKARMQREIERGGGDLWSPDDKVKDIARVIVEKISPTKVSELVRELARLAATQARLAHE